MCSTGAHAACAAPPTCCELSDPSAGGECMHPRNRDVRHPSGQHIQEGLQGEGFQRHHLHGSTTWTAESDPGSHGSCTGRTSNRRLPLPECLTWVHHCSVMHAGPGARSQRIPDRKKPPLMAGRDSISIGSSLRGRWGASRNHPFSSWDAEMPDAEGMCKMMMGKL